MKKMCLFLSSILCVPAFIRAQAPAPRPVITEQPVRFRPVVEGEPQPASTAPFGGIVATGDVLSVSGGISSAGVQTTIVERTESTVSTVTAAAGTRRLSPEELSPQTPSSAQVIEVYVPSRPTPPPMPVPSAVMPPLPVAPLPTAPVQLETRTLPASVREITVPPAGGFFADADPCFDLPDHPQETSLLADYDASVERPCIDPDLPPKRILYVEKNAPEPLQYYVDIAEPYDEILVAPGVYNTGGRQLDNKGPATRLVIDKPLTLRSEAGPEKTILEGGTLTRVIYLGNCARVIGFTIRDGETETLTEGIPGDELKAYSGAGVWSEPAGVLQDCIIVNNKALWYGGGLYGGQAVRCIFDENSSRRSGGGVSHSRLSNCLIKNNRAGHFGGGTHRTLMKNCTVVRNRCEMMGGGAAYGEAVNTVLHHNRTLLGNHNFFNIDLRHCFSAPVPPGPGNIGDVVGFSDKPVFKNSDRGNFEPVFNSMLIDRGTNVFCQAVDLNGNPRILDGNNNGHTAVDIGAYEYIHPQADSDGDGIPDRLEIEAGTPAYRFELPAQ
jgi:hypothetical protein